MLFDYRFWLRRFLEWLLNDSEEDECEKLVTKGIIGEPYFFISKFLHSNNINDTEHPLF